jgi:hypothetical protein
MTIDVGDEFHAFSLSKSIRTFRHRFRKNHVLGIRQLEHLEQPVPYHFQEFIHGNKPVEKLNLQMRSFGGHEFLSFL